jgi:hypothetical protein
VAVGVHRAKIVPEEAEPEFAPAPFQSTPLVDELVVLRPEVGVIRVDKILEVPGVFYLEFLDRLLLVLCLGNLLHVIGHRLSDLGIP